MAIKVANVTVIGDDRNITFTSNQCTSRGLSGNVSISDTDSLAGNGYSIDSNKVLTSSGKQFNCTVFDSSACLLLLDSLTPQQGTISSYSAGGYLPSPTPGARTERIDKFPFAADNPASDVGEISGCRTATSGQSSSTHGYVSGGQIPPGPPTPGGATDIIEKFPFALDGLVSDVAELTQGRCTTAGHSSSTHGYTSGGSAPPFTSTIEKFPFSSDSPATDVGELTCSRFESGGNSSREHGYATGGRGGVPSAALDMIDKFPFASDVSATCIGQMVSSTEDGVGQNSELKGFTSSNSGTLQIRSFPFASDENMTDLGDLTVARGGGAGTSSTTDGYTAGGAPPYSDVIDKFSFASCSNASDVGELSSGVAGNSGTQSGGNA